LIVSNETRQFGKCSTFVEKVFPRPRPDKNKGPDNFVRPVVIRFIRLHPDVQKCDRPTQSPFGPRHKQNLSANPETNGEIRINKTFGLAKRSMIIKLI